MSDGQIKKVWDVNREAQSRRGTLMHFQIECYLNGAEIETPHSPEFQQFLRFEQEQLRERGFLPVRTEVSLFHCGLGVAGQCDLLCRDGRGAIVIVDWKRSREICMQNRYQRMLPPLESLPDTNFNHYCLQLNLYKYILETEYDERVSLMVLGVFHPNYETYKTFEVPSMEREIRAVVELLKCQGIAEDPRPGKDALFTPKRLEPPRRNTTSSLLPRTPPPVDLQVAAAQYTIASCAVAGL